MLGFVGLRRAVTGIVSSRITGDMLGCVGEIHRSRQLQRDTLVASRDNCGYVRLHGVSRRRNFLACASETSDVAGLC